MLLYRMVHFNAARRMLNKWLCSSRVERATHNRLVTGSNPVGAKSFFAIAATLTLTIAPPALAQSTNRPSLPLSGTSSTQSNSPAQPSTLNSGPSTPAADMPPSNPSEPSLRPAIDRNTPTGSSGSPNEAGASWPPYDTLPLGVDQFQAPAIKTVESGGPVGTILQLTDEFTQNKPCINCIGVKVKIQNAGSNPVIIDGERAQAVSSGGATVRTLSEDDAMHLSGDQLTRKQKLILAATLVGTLGYAEPILNDHFTTSKTDFPVSYGLNENRRRLENRRLSRRIVLPGEDTEGTIYFPGDSISFDKITIPLLTFPVGLAAGSLEIARNAPPINLPETGSKPGPNPPLINSPYDPGKELIPRVKLKEEE